MKKRVKLTIATAPEPGFLPRVLLIFSRRNIPLYKVIFEVLDLNRGFSCRLEFELSEELLQKITKQIQNIPGVEYLTSEVKERDLTPVN